MKRVIVIGDAAMGKSTLSKKISKKFNLPSYCIDDFFYIKKYTKKRPLEKSVDLVKKTFAKKSWLVEGTSRHMMRYGLEKADSIIFLKSKSLMRQLYLLAMRKDKNQDLKSRLRLMSYLIQKKFNIGRAKGKISYEELLEPYSDKLITLHNFKEIEKWYESLTTIKKP